jgi:hypothetical protein
VFAAAKSDFETDAVDGGIEQFGEVAATRAGDIDRKPRQQLRDQVGLMRAQFVALAAAEEGALAFDGHIARVRFAIFAVAVSAGHRSVW